MRNKNMMIMGIVMVICQVMVMAGFGLLFAYDAGTRVMISSSTATMIIAGTFLVLVNILAIGLISYGAADSE